MGLDGWLDEVGCPPPYWYAELILCVVSFFLWNIIIPNQRCRVIVFIDGQLICLAKGIMSSYLTSLVEAVLVLSVYAPNEGLAINLQ